MLCRRQKATPKNQPVCFLVARAESDPDGLLFDDGVTGATNKVALEFVSKLASYFDDLGVKRGDIVGLNMPPTLYLYFLLATWYKNGTATNYTKQIARDNLWEPDWIFSTVEFEARDKTKSILVTRQILDQIQSREAIFELNPYKAVTDPLVLIFSSGSTGTPKAFSLSLENLEARMPAYWDPSFEFKGSLYLLDIGTASGIGSFYGELRTDGCYLIPGDNQTNLNNVIKHKTRSVLGSPNQLINFFTAAQQSSLLRSQVTNLIVTGATLPEIIATQMQNYFNCEIINAYGSQEVGLISQRRGPEIDPFNLGKIISGLKIEIVDELNRKLPIGSTGRIRTKSKTITSEYFRDEENTKKFFVDDWFYSGDLGHIGTNSHLYLDGRASEVINAGGVKLDPAKIDSFIIGKFGVLDAGSFRFAEVAGSENIGVAIVVNENFQEMLLIEGLKDFFGTTFPFSLYKVDKIARNIRGKVSRLDIAAKYLESLKN